MAPWLPALTCPCGGIASGGVRPGTNHGNGGNDGNDDDDSNDGVTCASCGARARRDRGVLRLLSSERLAHVEPFLAQYRSVRARDGYRVAERDYYRSLPWVASGDPQQAIWRVRQDSFSSLERHVLVSLRAPEPAVLDLGAGCGWLSYRLAKKGCRVVAVDLLDDQEDGLGASRHYDASFVCVQADFEELPFVSGQFDLVVFNASLHYAADVTATVTRAARMVSPGGTLVVMDSPLVDRDEHGRAMLRRKQRRFREEYGVCSPIEPGKGFLTLAELGEIARTLGLEQQFVESHRSDLGRGGPGDERADSGHSSGTGSRSTIGRLLTRFTRASRPARFGVWVAR
jgi:2-polyprenyl-3-methyl-5-hydroxy-6-metoxy-1,4-benzoquinol methylase